jgi:MFS family permease
MSDATRVPYELQGSTFPAHACFDSKSRVMSMAPRAAVRSLLRREVIAVCAVAFLADIVAGILNATFSLYAAGLGASVVFIGLLTSLSGGAALLASIPVGILSDRIGRRRVLVAGMACFALAMACFAAAPSPPFLIPGRLLFGLAMVATFWIAAAYLGDMVSGSLRGVAFGLFTTAMGLGFAVGPLLGGEVAEMAGIRAAFVLAFAAALIGTAIVIVELRDVHPGPERSSRPRASLRESLRVGRERALIIAGVANIVSSVTFVGAIVTIFPLYGAAHGLPTGIIGTMFAFRALASTAFRLPSGVLASGIGSGRVMLAALLIEVIATAGMGMARQFETMLAWLILEGIGFGAFLASSQAYVAEHTVEATRGAAIGFYSMTGGIGNAAAPLFLGAVASLFGLGAGFFAAGGVGLVGLAIIAGISMRGPQPEPDLRRDRV